jgi:Uncharacterized protein conserved in bacteria
MPRPTRTRKAIETTARAAIVAAMLAMPASAGAADRTLHLYNTNTKERLTVTFKRGGRYDQRALEKLNWFLRDWRKDEATKMDPALFDTIWEVYRQSGATQPIHVHSGYRSRSTNQMLRRRSKAVAEHSQHINGKAIDFHIPGVPASKLREIALRMEDGGVGFYPNARMPFVHVDVGSVRHWPRMTRSQLARIFPDGKTLHIPADGKPMPGYEQALARLERNNRTAEEDGPSFLETLFGFGRAAKSTSVEVASVAQDKGKASRSSDRPHTLPAPPQRNASAGTRVAMAVPLPPRRELAPELPVMDMLGLTSFRSPTSTVAMTDATGERMRPRSVLGLEGLPVLASSPIPVDASSPAASGLDAMKTTEIAMSPDGDERQAEPTVVFSSISLDPSGPRSFSDGLPEMPPADRFIAAESPESPPTTDVLAHVTRTFSAFEKRPVDLPDRIARVFGG